MRTKRKPNPYKVMTFFDFGGNEVFEGDTSLEIIKAMTEVIYNNILFINNAKFSNKSYEQKIDYFQEFIANFTTTLVYLEEIPAIIIASKNHLNILNSNYYLNKIDNFQDNFGMFYLQLNNNYPYI